METGKSPDRFWHLTPRQVESELKAHVAAKSRDRDDLIFLAWHIEAFARQKKLPPLQDLLAKTSKAKKVKKESRWEELAFHFQSMAKG